VIDYLNQQESVHQFLASVLSLVDASVSEYQRRGFQEFNGFVWLHRRGSIARYIWRSKVARRLRGRNGVEVVVTHRELDRGLENAAEWKAMILAAGLGTPLAATH